MIFKKIVKKKIIILLFFFLINTKSFAFDNDIEDLKKEIRILQTKINDLNDTINNITNTVQYNRNFFGGIFFSINKSNNQSKLNDKLYKIPKRKEDYYNFKVNQIKIIMENKIKEDFDFKILLKFFNSTFRIPEAYFKYYLSANTTLSIGQISTIISSENENSANGFQFSNQSTYFGIKDIFFYNGIGFKVSQIYDNFGVFYGLYGNSYSESVDNLSKSVAVFRTYYNPYKNKNNLIHFGVDYYLSHAKYKSDIVPNIDGSNLLYTISNVNNIVLEFSVNYENINLQSNYAFSIVKPSKKGYNKDFNFYNYYIQIGYIPTGESLEYDSGSFGIIDNVRRPIDSGGFGAFETVFRYSKTNMQDIVSNIVFDYGSYDKYSFAVNWMPINNAKFIFEYSRILEKFIDNYMTSKINNGTKNSYDMFTIMFKLFF